MQLGVARETLPGERRVATVPEVVARLRAAGHSVVIESGAGLAAFHLDTAYLERGATVVASAAEAYRTCDVICKVQPPTPAEAHEMPEGATLLSFFPPASCLEALRVLCGTRATVFSLDLLPRISRAQTMDALSSQATVSGYRAGLLAAELLPKFFPMFMTAAGTVPPARVVVLGAGVAGLQAIATARRLGAVVRAFDVRQAAREEVRSLGATFIELPLEAQEGAGGYAGEQSADFLLRQQDLIGNEVAGADAVITTAAIPGRRAPVLVTTAMVEAMAPGSVVIDLAAESGGNCELSQAGVDVLHGGVTVRGVANLASSMPVHASFLYARNIAELAGLLSHDGALSPDFEDEIVSQSCLLRQGHLRHGPTAELLGRVEVGER